MIVDYATLNSVIKHRALYINSVQVNNYCKQLNIKQMTRQEVKRGYAVAAIEAAKKKGYSNPVIVMPVFINEGTEKNEVWVPTNEVAILGNNPEWCAVNVVSITNTYSGGFERELYLSALIRRRVAGTEEKYKAGMVLPGRIYTVESTVAPNPANIEDGVKYITSSLREAKVPCMLGDKEVYQQHFYTDVFDTQDVIVAHDNDAELQAELLRLKAVASKPNTTAIRNVGTKRLQGAK